MNATPNPANRVAIIGDGVVIAVWDAPGPNRFRLVRTRADKHSTGQVRFDVRTGQGPWRPVWAFRYKGPEIFQPRELSVDSYSPDYVTDQCAPRFAHWWSTR